MIIGNAITLGGGGRCPRAVPIGILDYGYVTDEMSWTNTAYEKAD